MRSTPNRNQFQHKDNPRKQDMNDETLKFIKIIISKGSSVPGGVTRSRIRLLVEKAIFSKEEFSKMVKVVDREMKRKKKVAV